MSTNVNRMGWERFPTVLEHPELASLKGDLTSLGNLPREELGQVVNGLYRKTIKAPLTERQAEIFNRSVKDGGRRIKRVVADHFEKEAPMRKRTFSNSRDYALNTLLKAYSQEGVNSLKLMGEQDTIMAMHYLGTFTDAACLKFFALELEAAAAGEKTSFDSDPLFNQFKESVLKRYSAETDSERKAYFQYITASLKQKAAELDLTRLMGQRA
jgi:hypothetical protein